MRRRASGNEASGRPFFWRPAYAYSEGWTKTKSSESLHHPMPTFNFSVDSALLKELGERLVGKPHIALAELVKNSFDADALNVVIKLEDDKIIVSDNGHGMSHDEFRDYWMRIGSPHKGREGYSRELRRPLTGSKGVGRLAGQFLARGMTIHTVAKKNPEQELVGEVDWEAASQAGDLTEAKVKYTEGVRKTLFPANSRHGTKIVLHELNQNWDADSIRNLAREIWWLQPPFRANPSLEVDRATAFDAKLETEDKRLMETFEAQMKAILSLYHVRIMGKLTRSLDGIGTVDLILEWEDGPVVEQRYTIPNCRLHYAEFQIRVYHLHRRQKQGIAVQDARDYLNKHGQVHIYDAGFHLPYYGPEQDWLGVERDHSHRLSASQLLPKAMQVSHGLNYLPTGSRLLGVVDVDTAIERREAERTQAVEEKQHLMVQITRDRLVDNEAFQNLFFMVRWALDFYAMQEAAREFEEKKARAKTKPARDKLQHVEEVLESFKDRIEANAYRELRKNVKEVVEIADEEAEQRTRETGLLGALATAGMSAVAFRHELNKQLLVLKRYVDEIRDVKVDDRVLQTRLMKIADDLETWHNVARSTQSLFLGIADRESRERIDRYRAKPLIDSVRRQVDLLIPGLPIDIEKIDPEIRLPEGTFVEWSAIFQNVLVNAANALLDAQNPRIQVSSEADRRDRAIFVEDNGKGVDLKTANELFRPFVRRLIISRERKEMGMGGTGIGLTIVQMLADTLNSKVSFVEPSDGFNTAFRVSWTESHE
jgi:signal transduction histidine kinase